MTHIVGGTTLLFLLRYGDLAAIPIKNAPDF
jgi:hypothetical protein